MQALVSASSAEAEAAYGNASRQYERMKNLFATQSASKKEMDDTETMYRMAAAKLEAVKEMEREVANALEYGELRSPIDGSVVARMVQEGDLAAPGMPLVVVEDNRSFVVVARVPETEIAAVAVGDPVRLAIDALDGELAGKVTQVNAAGDPASRQFSVKIAVAATDGLRSGMNARASLLKGSALVVTVPTSAIVRRGELDGLFLLGENHTAVLQWIRTGGSTGEVTEILSGLRPGETVLVSGTDDLRDGQPVEVSQ
jgi:RND family efflux transporter MFP subunit